MKTSPICLIALTTALLSGAALADSKCSDVNIQITNDYRDPVTNAQVDIKVVDFEYWDKEDNKWRGESTTNKRIDPGQTGIWNKALEYVGGESGVKLKVYFKYEQAGGGWSTEHSQQSGSFTCIDGMVVAVDIS